MSIYQGIAHNSRWVPKNLRTVVVEIGGGQPHFSICLACQEHRKCVILGTNGVAMARHGLILSQDGATRLRKVFKYLPGLRDTILRPKLAGKVHK